MPQLQAEAESPQGQRENPGYLPEMQASVYQKSIKSGPLGFGGPLFVNRSISRLSSNDVTAPKGYLVTALLVKRRRGQSTATKPNCAGRVFG